MTDTPAQQIVSPSTEPRKMLRSFIERTRHIEDAAAAAEAAHNKMLAEQEKYHRAEKDPNLSPEEQDFHRAEALRNCEHFYDRLTREYDRMKRACEKTSELLEDLRGLLDNCEVRVNEIEDTVDVLKDTSFKIYYQLDDDTTDRNRAAASAKGKKVSKKG